MVGSPTASSGIERKKIKTDTYLDVKKGLQSLGGRVKIYRRVVDLFFSEFEDVDQVIVQSMQDGDIEKANRLAHSVKSAAGQIGALSLSVIAAKLEKAISEENSEFESLLSLFQHDLKAVLTAISDYLSSAENPVK